MHVWILLHAARWKCRTQKWRKKSPSGHHRTTLSAYIFATKARVLTIGKNLLSSNISLTCPHNMVNFGPLAAEISWRVWGTPANFNGFCVLVALLHDSQVVGVSQTAALNRGCHLYSAGWPSHWALAHISSLCLFSPVVYLLCFRMCSLSRGTKLYSSFVQSRGLGISHKVATLPVTSAK